MLGLDRSLVIRVSKLGSWSLERLKDLNEVK